MNLPEGDSGAKGVVSKYREFLKTAGYSNPTVKNYLADIRRFLTWATERLPEFNLYQLSETDLRDYQSHLQTELSDKPAILPRRLSSLRNFLFWARKQGFVPTTLTFPKELPTQLTRAVPTEAPAVVAVPTAPKRLHQKVIHHIKNTRPAWYHRYHKLDFVHTTHMVILVLYVLAVGGFLFYTYIFKPNLEKTKEELGEVLAAATPPRILSFQGRLTDSNNVPITSATNIVFRIWDQASGGTEVACDGGGDEDCLWKSATRSVTPDQNGIFSVILGDTSAGDPAIPSTLFSENAELYLGVKVGTDSEMTPRQRIASVSYALNSDALEGFHGSQTPGANEVPILNSSGNLMFAGAAMIGTAASGALTLDSDSGTLTLGAGTNTIVNTDGSTAMLLNPTGDLQFQSSSNYITSAGAMTLAGGVSIGSGQSYTGAGAVTLSSASNTDLTIDAQGTGNIVFTGFTSCTALETNGSAQLVCGTDDGGGGALHQITAATDNASINNSAYNIVWNWQLAGTEVGFKFSENAASTGGGTNDQFILEASTLAGSTASPLRVLSNSADAADIVFNLNSDGDFEIQDAGTAFVTFSSTGTTTINSGGLTITSGALAVNSDSISSDGALGISATSGTITIDSSGTVQLGTDDDLLPQLGSGDADLGASGTRWDNIYAAAGNFSGTVTVNDLSCTNCLNETEIEDIYLLNSGDTSTGQLIITAVPTGTGVGQGSLYINPASATDDYTLLGLAVNGTEVLRVDEDGDLDAAGHGAFGSDASVASDKTIYATETQTSAADFYGIYSSVVGPNVTNSNSFWALYGKLRIPAVADNYTGASVGAIRGECDIAIDTSTISWCKAFEAIGTRNQEVYGTLSKYAGLYTNPFEGWASASFNLTITDQYGVYIDGTPSVTTGLSLGSNYGLYIEDLWSSGSTTRYPIYQAGSSGNNILKAHTSIGNPFLGAEPTGNGVLNIDEGIIISGSSKFAVDVSNRVNWSGDQSAYSFSAIYAEPQPYVLSGSYTLGWIRGVESNFTDIGVASNTTVQHYAAFYVADPTLDDPDLTITNAYGFYIDNIAAEGATISNTYPIYQAGTNGTNIFNAATTFTLPAGTVDFTITGIDSDSNVIFSGLNNCDTIDTDANGVLSCGTDAGAGSSPFSSSSGVITKTTASDYLSLRYGDAADTQLIIENTTSTTIPTADAMQIDLSGNTTGIITNGVDALYIKAEFGNGSANTNSLLHLDLDPVNTPSGDEYFYAVNIDALAAGTSANERAIYVGANWDYVLDSAAVDISGAGVISGATGFTSSGTITFSSYADCSALATNGSGALFCGAKTRSFLDNTNDTISDSDTVNYWDGTYPNITPKATTNEILVIVSFYIDGAGTTDVTFAGRILRTTGGTDPVCQTTGTIVPNTSSYVGGGLNDGMGSFTATFVDAPGVTSEVRYTLCGDADGSVTAGNMRQIEFTLIEIDDAADLAEVYPTNDTSLQPGEIVSLDPDLTFGVRRSARAYDRNVLGVVSTRPAQVIGSREGKGASGVPVALTGRVPVKVNGENGPIAVGDLITSSSTPGVGMRANRPGYVIGRALTGFNGEGEGTVLAFVNTHYANPANLLSTPEVDTESSNLLNLDGINATASASLCKDGPCKALPIQLDSENNITATISAGTKFIWTNSVGKVLAWVSDAGEVVFEKITALVGDFRKLIFGELVAEKDSQVAGQANFEPGQTEVFIESDKVTEESLIYITPTTKTAGLTLYLKAQKPGEGFVVALERSIGDLPNEATASAKQTIRFNWLIINQEE